MLNTVDFNHAYLQQDVIDTALYAKQLTEKGVSLVPGLLQKSYYKPQYYAHGADRDIALHYVLMFCNKAISIDQVRGMIESDTALFEEKRLVAAIFDNVPLTVNMMIYAWDMFQLPCMKYTSQVYELQLWLHKKRYESAPAGYTRKSVQYLFYTSGIVPRLENVVPDITMLYDMCKSAGEAQCCPELFYNGYIGKVFLLLMLRYLRERRLYLLPAVDTVPDFDVSADKYVESLRRRIVTEEQFNSLYSTLMVTRPMSIFYELSHGFFSTRNLRVEMLSHDAGSVSFNFETKVLKDSCLAASTRTRNDAEFLIFSQVLADCNIPIQDSLLSDFTVDSLPEPAVVTSFGSLYRDGKRIYVVTSNTVCLLTLDCGGNLVIVVNPVKLFTGLKELNKFCRNKPATQKNVYVGLFYIMLYILI